jgi:hypothetical protein
MSGRLKDKIAERIRQTQEDVNTVADDFNQKGDTFRAEISRLFDHSLRNQEDVQMRCQGLAGILQKERQERNKLEAQRRKQTEEKQQDLVRAVHITREEMEKNDSQVVSIVSNRNTELIESWRCFGSKLDALSKAGPEHYLKEAEEHRTTFVGKEGGFRGDVRRMEKRLRDNWSETETLRGAVARQLDDLCKKQDRELKDRQQRLLVSIQARRDELMELLDKASDGLGLS